MELLLRQVTLGGFEVLQNFLKEFSNLKWLFCRFRDSNKPYGILQLSSISADNEEVGGFEWCVDFSAIDIALSSEVCLALFYSL